MKTIIDRYILKCFGKMYVIKIEESSKEASGYKSSRSNTGRNTKLIKYLINIIN